MSEFTPIIVAIIAGLFGQPIVELISSCVKRNLKNIRNADAIIKTLKNSETDFIKNFILPDIKERCFHMQTGVRTNENSIGKLVEFKKSLGGNYTWNHIKIAKKYLKFDNQGVEIKLSRFDKAFCNIIFIIGLLFLTVVLIGLIYFSQFETRNLKAALVTMFALVVSMLVGYFFIKEISSIIVARGLERRINALK
ncbi:MAG: hypothetical protein ACFB0B_09175 [Thermonemataceae bacterium]|mgnify:CR=1 FL=1